MKKQVIQTLILLVVIGLLIWHSFQWHSSRMYLEMFNWAGTDKVHITVLYNLALMVGLGVLLGFLMERITYLLSFKIKKRL